MSRVPARQSNQANTFAHLLEFTETVPYEYDNPTVVPDLTLVGDWWTLFPVGGQRPKRGTILTLDIYCWLFSRDGPSFSPCRQIRKKRAFFMLHTDFSCSLSTSTNQSVARACTVLCVACRRCRCRPPPQCGDWPRPGVVVLGFGCHGS